MVLQLLDYRGQMDVHGDFPASKSRAEKEKDGDDILEEQM